MSEWRGTAVGGIRRRLTGFRGEGPACSEGRGGDSGGLSVVTALVLVTKVYRTVRRQSHKKSSVYRINFKIR
jgi:hypothetical protein